MVRNWLPKSWRRFLYPKQSSRKPSRPVHYRPYLEVLEDRLVLSNIFTVTTTSDSGTGSLRQAITNADGASGSSTIDFAIPTSDSGYNSSTGAWTISLASALPTITNPMTIDGSSQTGFTGTPLIVLNGSGAGAGANGLTITAGNSTVKDLVIDNFAALEEVGGNGIEIDTGGDNVLTGNYIGVDSTGEIAAGNGGGVYINGSANNTVGGTTAADRNVISDDDVSITGSGATGNVVEGNYLGTDATGTANLVGGGVYITSTNNRVGGTMAGAGNVISPNGGDGVDIGGSSNVVEGNYIGIDAAGTANLANVNSGSGNGVNSGNGVDIGGSNNTVGGTAAGAGNVISSNNIGVYIRGSIGTTGNVVEGNYIGTDKTGTAALGNYTGVAFDAITTNNTVGGTTAAARNIISGNIEAGVYSAHGTSTTGNVVEGNYIGTDVTGTKALGNGYGVEIASANNTIGGTVSGAGNVISANTYSGVEITYGGFYGGGNVVEGNLIGTDKNGTANLGNGIGVYIGYGASSNMVGGTTPAARNVIAYSSNDGVEVDGSTTTGDAIRENSIHDNGYLADGGLGIDLSNGGNNNQPAPLLISAITSGNSITIQGMLSAAPSTSYALDFFASPTLDKMGNAEGQQYLGSATVTNDRFTETFNVSVPGGYFITATDTDPNGNTSEFSKYVTATSNLFVVTNTNDSGAGSLRQAITDANAASGYSVIDFAIPTSDPGYNSSTGAWTIAPASALPTITNAVTIDGSSQPGFSGTPLIVLNGTSAGSGANGLTITAGNSFVADLAIDNFSGDGIELETGGDDVLMGNYIGVDSTGKSAAANGIGVNIYSSANNTVGGTAAAERNVISANTYFGVDIDGSGATGNQVQGNYVGTDVTGAAKLGNGYGVVISAGAANNTVGGTVTAALNVISGNTNSGVEIENSGTTGNQVQGNYIGTDLTGTIALGNGYGVEIYETANNTVGGTAAGALNVLSANTFGVDLYGSGAIGNAVQGNYIGTDKSGAKALANEYGVYIEVGSASNTVGGTTAAARNVISANTQEGVLIDGSGSTGNVVQGNYIGTDVTGAVKLGNEYGVFIADGAANNTVGGTTAAARNVLSANTYGVIIESSGSTGNIVQGNYIGTDATGDTTVTNLGNTDGVLIESANNSVGGTTAGAGNVISANTYVGVEIAYSGATGTVLQGNYIGTDYTGANALGNGYGVEIYESANNAVGGTATGASNIIAYSSNDGVYVYTGTGNAIRQNSIHDSGGLGIDLVSGGNNGQAAPALTSATTTGSSITITGTLTATANTTYALDFFANSTLDSSGNAEGQQYLGSAMVTTNASGSASISETLNVSVPSGYYVSATATDPNGNTSEFAKSVTAS